MGTTQRIYSPGLFYLGWLVGAAGLAFYLSSSSLLGSAANWPLSVFLGSATLKFNFLGSFPSLSHALASSLLLASLCAISVRTKLLSIFLLLWVLLTLELTLGTFDIVDVFALLLGSGLGAMAAFINVKRKIVNRTIGVVPAVLISVGAAAVAIGSYQQEPGCARYEGSECVASKRFATPRYMSYSDLRSAVKLEDAHDLKAIGRLYLYKSLIFMNERNEGIHIIDNRFPANPTPIGFVRIPGNLDISIRGDYLYADSYVDMVTIDLTDLDNISEVSRDIDIFPFDAFQNIPNDIDFEFGLVDSSRGVIIGYE